VSAPVAFQVLSSGWRPRKCRQVLSSLMFTVSQAARQQEDLPSQRWLRRRCRPDVSSESVGKSAGISAVVAPSARLARTVLSVTRVP